MYPLGGNFEQHKEAHKPAPRRVPGESPDSARRKRPTRNSISHRPRHLILLRYAGRPACVNLTCARVVGQFPRITIHFEADKFIIHNLPIGGDRISTSKGI